jgi:SAM-dependent methyltransferase
MLRLAEGNARRLGAGNVSFRSHDMYRLSELRDGPYDLVIWTLAAHHCLTTDDVVAVLNGIADVLVPGGAFFLFDLIRPKSGALAVRFADAYNRGQGSWFYHDSLDSYKAAFTFEEMGDALRRSRLRHAHHVQPAFGNFFQFAAIPAASPGGAQPVRHLRHLWQRRDYALLRFAFALSQWTQRP